MPSKSSRGESLCFLLQLLEAANIPFLMANSFLSLKPATLHFSDHFLIFTSFCDHIQEWTSTVWLDWAHPVNLRLPLQDNLCVLGTTCHIRDEYCSLPYAHKYHLDSQIIVPPGFYPFLRKAMLSTRLVDLLSPFYFKALDTQLFSTMWVFAVNTSNECFKQWSHYFHPTLNVWFSRIPGV